MAKVRNILYEELQEIKKINFKKVIMWSMPGCNWCNRQLNQLRKFGNEVTVFVCDVMMLSDEEYETEKKENGIENAPTVIFLDENGEVFYKSEGYVDFSEIEEIWAG